MFQVGQKVICINDNFDNIKNRHGCLLPKFGHTYTIRAMMEDGLLLREIINPEFYFIKLKITSEPHFHQSRFVPAIDESEIAETKKLEYA